jgi:hypothetical protein
VSGEIRRDAATEPNAPRPNARRALLAIVAAAIGADVVRVARAVAPP